MALKKKEWGFYLFCKTKPRHSSQIFLTVRMIEEGCYFIGQPLACALVLTPTQRLQSRKGICMCQCPKEKKTNRFYNNSVLKFSYYREVICNSSSPEGLMGWGCGKQNNLLIYWYSSSWNTSCVNKKDIPYRMVESKWIQ